MKSIFIAALLLMSQAAFSQLEKTSKIVFKVKADCKCAIQLAINHKPAGDLLEMISDSFQIAIGPEISGFFLTCGESNVVYFKIKYQPGDSYYRIYGTMPCDKSRVDDLFIKPTFN